MQRTLEISLTASASVGHVTFLLAVSLSRVTLFPQAETNKNTCLTTKNRCATHFKNIYRIFCTQGQQFCHQDKSQFDLGLLA